jgi:hypothetical protein
LLCSLVVAQTPEYQSTLTFETKFDDFIQTRDGSGNIYLTGTFTDSFDANPSASKSMLYTNYARAVFVSKLNKNGELIWAKKIESNQGSSLTVSSIALNNNETSVIAYGTYFDTIYGSAPDSIESRKSAGGTDVFFARFNSQNGKFERLSSAGSTSNESAQHLLFDKDNNFYYSVMQNISSNNHYLLIYKNTESGTNVFQHNLNSNFSIFTRGLALDSSNNLYILGMYSGLVYGSNGANISTVSVGRNNIFVRKLSPSGAHLSTFRRGVNNIDVFPTELKVTPNGESYIT